MVKKKLLMRFKTDEGKGYNIYLDNPREDITETEIKAVMDLILGKNIVEVNGMKISKAVEARIVTTNEIIHDLVV